MKLTNKSFKLLKMLTEQEIFLCVIYNREKWRKSKRGGHKKTTQCGYIDKVKPIKAQS